jgi:hypothetical protein
MNRQQIRAKVKGLLNRNDCTDELANDFINMAQTRIERTLRSPGQEKISVSTGNALTVEDEIVIPFDFLSLKHMYSGDVLLSNKDLGHFLSLPKESGQPRYYCRVAGSYLMKPAVPLGTSVYMIYYGAQPALVNDTDTNLFTTVLADLLIYCALAFGADYFVDDRVTGFETKYEILYAEVEEQSRLTDTDQSTQAMEPAYSGDY